MLENEMKRLFACLVVALLGLGFATTTFGDANAAPKPRPESCTDC
jgi:hypothetical protein